MNKNEVKIMVGERKRDDNGEEKERQERKKKEIKSCGRRWKAEL